ncbi:SDR family oxidoreductase [Nocardioides limicola]|uniref:SDR family oxidoreductase n=1 Tax=Nocardioides limicola TaxID=2803368 RepID=UPI00193C2ECC|nr:SDR family oxidoreductase [Nocardioides sp. DJM-14]
MSILVTGTSGHLGRLVVEALLERGVPAADIVATARTTESIGDLAARGVQTRRADYSDPASLDAAFAGVDRALLVSSSEIGQRAAQHRNVIDAAKRAGVSLLAYTSILNAPTSRLLLAAEHQETEAYLATSGVPHALLRNGWYTENWTGQLAVQLEHGVVGAAGDGRVSAAPRADFAAAAAAVLLSDDAAGSVHELGGAAFTLTEYAAALSVASGQQVSYTDLDTDAYAQVLVGVGLPEAVAAVFADGDRGVREGELFVEPTALEALIGRPATPLADVVKATLAG